GIALLVVGALAWVMPFNSGLLEFSQAEVQFLFPAPVSRRALLVHRMLRSQIGLLFGGAIMAVAVPSAAGYGRLRTGVAMWLLLSIGKVYFTGVSLTRARVAAASGRERLLASLPLAAILIAVVLVARSLVGVLLAGPIGNAEDLFVRIGTATSSGAAGL